MSGVFLENLTWLEAELLLQSDKVIILPIGAQTKEHGPHLPLNTDWLTAQYLTQAIVESIKVIALPTVAYGYYPAFSEYAGSISLQETTFTDTVLQIIHSIHQHGASKFYVLNTGISTNPALHSIQHKLNEQQISMNYTDLTTIISDIEANIEEQALGSHADELETSMMLYMYPDRVDMNKAVPELNTKTGSGGFTKNTQATTGIISPSGSWGDPTLATKEKGQLIVQALIARIKQQIELL